MQRRLRYITFMGAFLSIATPILLYGAELFGVPIPTTPVWVGIYALGVIPMILTEVVFGLSGWGIAHTPIFLVAVGVLQGLLGYVVASTATWRVGSRRSDIGVFREEKPFVPAVVCVALMRIYVVAFWLYWLFYVVDFVLR